MGEEARGGYGNDTAYAWLWPLWGGGKIKGNPHEDQKKRAQLHEGKKKEMGRKELTVIEGGRKAEGGKISSRGSSGGMQPNQSQNYSEKGWPSGRGSGRETVR